MPAWNYALLVAIFCLAFVVGHAARPDDTPKPELPSATSDVTGAPRTSAPLPAASASASRARGPAARPARRIAPTPHEKLVREDPVGHAALRNAVGAGLRDLFPDLSPCLVDDGQIGLISLELRIDVTSDARSNQASVSSVSFDKVAEGSPLSPEAVACLTAALSQPIDVSAGRYPLPDFDGSLAHRIAFELAVPAEEDDAHDR